MLRRSSRLIVDGALPNARPMSVGPRPRPARSAIWTRSASERNRTEIVRTASGSIGGTNLTVPSFCRSHAPFFQRLPDAREISSFLHAAHRPTLRKQLQELPALLRHRTATRPF